MRSLNDKMNDLLKKGIDIRNFCAEPSMYREAFIYNRDLAYKWKYYNMKWCTTVDNMEKMMTISHKNNRGTTSLGEQCIYQFFKQNAFHVANQFRIDKYTFDVVIFDLNLVIEHQSAYHSNSNVQQNDIEKINYLHTNGINILYVDCSDAPNNGVVTYKYNDKKRGVSTYEVFREFLRNMVTRNEILSLINYYGMNRTFSDLTPDSFRKAWGATDNVPRPSDITAAQSIYGAEIARNPLNVIPPDEIKAWSRWVFYCKPGREALALNGVNGTSNKLNQASFPFPLPKK